MNKQSTKTLSLILVVTMLISAIVSVQIFAAGTSLSSLRNSYPHGSTWKSSYDGASQCHGWALMIADKAYGYSSSDSGRCRNRTRIYDTNSIKAGDVIRIYRSTAHSDSKAHTIFVTGVSGNNIVFADCNWDWNCGIRWDVTTTKASLTNNTFGYGIQYILSAPYALSEEPCTCSTSYAGEYKCTVKNGNVLYIRNGHGSSYSSIGSIPSGATVTVTKGDGSWAHVTYNGVTGYASMDYLQKIEHTHSYTGQRLQEVAHPHEISQRCVDYATCGGFIWTGEYGASKSCQQCWHVDWSVSASSISVKVGESKTINISIDGIWPDTAKAVSEGDKSLFNYTLSQGVLTVTGLKSGTGKIKISIYSDADLSVLIGSKTIPVTITEAHTHNYTGQRVHETAHPHEISQRCVDYETCGGFKWTGENAQVKTCSKCWNGSFTVSSSSVNVKVGNTQTVNISLSGFFPDSAVLHTDYNDSIVSVTSSGQTFTFKGLKKGSCKYVISVYSDSSKKTLICTKTISVTVEEASITKIVASLPSKTSYYIGDSFDSSGIKLTVTYSDGSTKTVTSGYTVSGFDSTSAGTKTVTVSYGGKSSSFSVKVIKPTITINSTDRALKIGESITVTAITDPSSKMVTWESGNTNIATVSNGKVTAVGEGGVSIYASFTYNGIKYETKFALTVTKPEVTLSSISAKTLPDKTSYYIGDSLNTAGLAITAKYSDGSSKTITSGYTVSGFSSSTEGTKTVTVSYEGKTTSFSVKVNTPSINILTDISGKLHGEIGQSFAPTVITAPSVGTITWRSENTSIATVSDGTITGVGQGTTNIYASFTYNGIKYETKVEITVTKPEAVLSSISVKALPDKASYYIGDSLNTAGLAITAKYSDGSSKTITSGFTTSGFNSSSAGNKTVTVSYSGKSASFTVNIIKPKITISTDYISLETGDSYTLTASSDPENIDLIWTSSDTGIASVSNGKVTAKSEGEVTVKVKFDYNGTTYNADCTIKVTDSGCKHKYTHIYEAVASTCTVQGHEKYIVCDDCKIIISGSDKLLPLLEHTPGEYTVTREPTYNVVGIEACFCTECGKQLDRRQIPILEYQNKFTDVKPTHWFWESVNYVARKGYMSGMSETKFSPNTELTREQFIQILFAMEKKDKSDYGGPTGFNDITSGKWYSPAIKWAKQEGITEGVGNGNFGLGASITREQMAKFMMSFAQYRGYNTDIRGDISTYKDAKKVASWAEESMQWCVGAGIYESTSTTEKTLEPRLTVKRAVAATVIMRFVQNTSK